MHFKILTKNEDFQIIWVKVRLESPKKMRIPTDPIPRGCTIANVCKNPVRNH